MQRAAWLFVALLLAVPLVGGMVLRLYGPEVEREALSNLEAIAELKAQQLENWLAERSGDAALLYNDRLLQSEIAQLAKSPKRSAVRADLQARFEAHATVYKLSKVLVVTSDQQELLSAGPDTEPVASPQITEGMEAARRASIARSNLYRGIDGDAHIQWTVPVFTAGDRIPVAYIVLRANADDFVYPLIQAWPTASTTGETLLARAFQGEVLFLNEFRHKKATALSLTAPLDSVDLPAAVALRRGGTGTIDGKDYRGERVLAAYRPVTSTDWVLVAKQDHAEVVAPLYRLTYWASFITLVAVAAVSLGFFLLWREFRRSHELAAVARQTQTELAERRLLDANRAALARAQMLIDGALDAVITIDEQGVIVGWNAQAEPVFGHTTEDALGRDMAGLIIPTHLRDGHRRGMVRYLAQRRSHILGRRIEVEGLRADGSVFPMELSIVSLEQDGATYFSAYVRDLTEQKQAQSALVRSMQLFARVFNASPIAAAITTAEDGRFQQVNDNFSRDFGYARETLLGKTAVEVGLWPSLQAREAFLRLLQQQGRLIEFETEWRRLDGAMRAVSISAEMTELDGQSCILSYSMDITDRKAVELQLQRLSLAIDQSPASVAITNREGKIEWVNEAFVRSSGYSREEALGKNPRILQSGRTPPETYHSMWETLKREEGWQGILYNRRKDGTEYTEQALLSPIRGADGTVTHYMATKEDVTEKHRMAQELEQHRDHLEELVQLRTTELEEARQAAETANKAKSAFLANMSHEIRTPMNAIVGFAHLLRRANPTPAQEDRLLKIEGAAKHLLSVINDILDISKIEAGRLVLEASDFHLTSLLDNVYSLLQEQARSKGLDLRIDPSSAALWLRGDVTRLRQALLNFVGNAIKFTPQGQVTVRALDMEQRDGLHVIRFEVQDTGIGIAVDQQQRLFAAFEQADVSTTRNYGGTGLGLAITRRLARMMGGEAGLHSVLGEGSTFWFTAVLPQGSSPNPGHNDTDPDSVDQALRQLAGARVLLADDVEVNREIVVQMLEGTGILVDQAENGRIAVERAQSTDYDLVLMDLQMPELDGLQATRHLRALPRCEAVPVVAMTANVFDEDREACLDAGMVDFVIKPIDPDHFYRTLLKWLPRRQRGTTKLHVPLGAMLGDTADGGDAFPGLDVEHGLKTWRQRSVHARFLRKFLADHADVAAQISQALQVSDAKAAAALAHKVKGAAGNLALTAVARLARDIDLGIKDGSDVGDAISQLHLALQAAREVVDRYAPPSASSVDVAAEPFGVEQRQRATALLQDLLRALDQDNPDAAEPMVAELEKFLPPDMLEVVRSCLTDFDFRGAEAATQQVLDRLEHLAPADP